MLLVYLTVVQNFVLSGWYFVQVKRLAFVNVYNTFDLGKPLTGDLYKIPAGKDEVLNNS